MPYYDAQEYSRSRGLTKPGAIDDDRCCLACGYRLRGLREAQRCPECGRPILPLRGQGLAETRTDYLQRLSHMLIVAWMGWALGMALWVWMYYGLLDKYLYTIAPAMIIANLIAVFGMIRAWNAIEGPRNPAQHRLLSACKALAVVGSVLLVLAVLFRTRWSGVLMGGQLVALVVLATLAWLGLETLACLLFQRIAVAGHDERLGERFWHVAWVIGLCAAFIAPFFAVTQIMVMRSGFAPSCCWGGYLVVIAMFIAQIVFAHSVLRLRSMVRWSVKYRNQYDSKSARLYDRIAEGRRTGDAEGTALRREEE